MSTLLRTNLVPNPRGMNTAAGWEWATNLTGAEAVQSWRDVGGPPGCPQWTRWDITTANTAQYLIVYGSNANTVTYNALVTPGQTITISAWAYHSAGHPTVRVETGWLTPAGSALTPQVVGPNITLAPGEWGHSSLTVAVPEGAAACRAKLVMVGIGLLRPGDVIGVAAFMIEPVTA